MVTHDYNETFAPIPKHPKINNVYFQWLCVIPWVFLTINIIFTYNLAYNIMFFQSTFSSILNLICVLLIILNIILVSKDKDELKKVNVIVKKNLIVHSIATVIFNALTLDSYFVARHKVWRYESGRFNTIIPLIIVSICWAYDIYKYIILKETLMGFSPY